MNLDQIETDIEPIRKQVVVARNPEEAFEIFTRRISAWWPKQSHSVSRERTKEVVLEPVQGGAIYEIRDDGERFLWGKVLIWESPNRLVLSWHPGYAEIQSQEVEVRFETVAGGTCVKLEHRGWQRLGERALETRERYDGGWTLVFGQCFVRACET